MSRIESSHPIHPSPGLTQSCEQPSGNISSGLLFVSRTDCGPNKQTSSRVVETILPPLPFQSRLVHRASFRNRLVTSRHGTGTFLITAQQRRSEGESQEEKRRWRKDESHARILAVFLCCRHLAYAHAHAHAHHGPTLCALFAPVRPPSQWSWLCPRKGIRLDTRNPSPRLMHPSQAAPPSTMAHTMVVSLQHPKAPVSDLRATH